MILNKYKNFKIYIKIILFFSVYILFSFRVTAQESNVELYSKVWEIINNEYVDDTKNHQDWNYWKSKYNNYLKTEADTNCAIRTMLLSLNDKYTKFLSFKSFEQEKNNINANVFGIGIILEKKDKKLLIKKIIKNSSAEYAGLKKGDEVISINKILTKNIDLRTANKKIYEKNGTYVKLTIKRDGTKNKVYKIKRLPMKINSISTIPPNNMSLNSEIGYIKISSFNGKTTIENFKQILKENKNKKGIIIDIRDNLGGILDSAIEIADFFLSDCIIAKTTKSNGLQNDIKATPKTYYDKALVILVNNKTASSSEIFAAALQDNERAILIGEYTYGKGYVQEIKNLSPYKGGLCLTVEKYLTPNGKDINKIGIKPNIIIYINNEDITNNNDPQLKKAEELLTKFLTN